MKQLNHISTGDIFFSTGKCHYKFLVTNCINIRLPNMLNWVLICFGT